MKCKSHPYEYGVGVCASCLRERLLALAAAQNEATARHHHHQHHHAGARWRFDPPRPLPQPSLIFDLPVSPHISHRRSVGSNASPAHARLHQFQRFFSTPQIGPTFSPADGAVGGLGEIDGGRKRRFSTALKMLFRHQKSEEAEPRFGASSVPTSGSWFSALIRRRMKSKKKIESRLSSATEDEEATASRRTRRSCRAVDRGMSPTKEDEEDQESGYSSDEWRRPTPTPMRRFPANPRQHRSIGAISGFSVCLSPLVSFGPESRRGHPAELGIPGDLRSPRSSVHHRNPAVTPNRSRKLADIGTWDGQWVGQIKSCNGRLTT